jgi:O-antigen/teichoic acid export membrane protein
VDKVLALRGGAEAVALWAQLSSVIELVAGIALAGIGGGLAVLVAQAAEPERRRELLRQALATGLALSLAAALAVVAAGALLESGALPRLTVAAAALAGWIAVIPGLLNSYWLGRERRGAQLALAAATALLAVAASAWAPPGRMLEWLLVAQAAPALVLLAVWRPRERRPRDPAQASALRRYILPGIAIGILSPASLLAARALVAAALSWHDAGVLQALWRVSDWIFGFASGVLSVLYLARMSSAHPRGELGEVTRAAARVVLLPSALLFALLLVFHVPLLAALYDADFVVSGTAAALFFAGSVLRIASWIPLYALYAMSRTRAIAAGELLSLPLFAALLAACGENLTLELAGAAWLLSFLAYAAFNYWAMRRS